MPRLLIRMTFAAAVLALSLAPAGMGRGAAPASLAPDPQALGSILTTTRNPGRNLYTLTARLKLHSTAPINPYVNSKPADYPIGHIDRFYIANSQSGYTRQTAVLAYKTMHAYFYVQQGMHVDRQQLARSARVFEGRTYPTNHAIFGLEWSPGVDNDRHITVFNGQVPDVAGYFSVEDLYPRVINRFSNQRKMIYINLGAEQPGTSSYDSTLAHEFQHMIHAHLHPADEAWINEGSSILAQELNGYGASGFDGSKAASPDAQLNTWDVLNYGPYYGGGYLWMLYLYEHYGGNRAIHTMLADTGLSNMALFDDVLAKLGAHVRVDDMFADWVIANFVNDRRINGGRFGYHRTDVKATATAQPRLPFTYHSTMHQYAANYLDLSGVAGKAVTLTFTGRPTVPLLHTITPSQGVWWSNRGDNIDTTLTLPPLDLRGVHHAVLQYQAWYNLESDYDYGYVEISADGGTTWYAQRTPHTTNSNPNGANIGNGYTGSSCSRASRVRSCWVDERLDLARYAGKRILVRFEQVTDDEYNLDGLAIAHLRVPALGFDGDNMATGWQPAGWVRAGNTLLEHWIVQAIVYRSTGISVTRMPVGANGQGSLHVPVGASRIVVSISATAPLTTRTSPYMLSGRS